MAKRRLPQLRAQFQQEVQYAQIKITYSDHYLGSRVHLTLIESIYGMSERID